MFIANFFFYIATIPFPTPQDLMGISSQPTYARLLSQSKGSIKGQKVIYIPPKNLGAPEITGAAVVRQTGSPIENRYQHALPTPAPAAPALPAPVPPPPPSPVTCTASNCLVPLVPNDRAQLEHLPQTISEYPSFFFNVPRTRGMGKLRLFAEGQETSPPKQVYETTFPVDTPGGIIRFDLPKDAPALNIDKTYRWEFSFVSPKTYRAEGFIRRVKLDPFLVKQIGAAKPLEQAAIYAKNGIWFETIQTLVEARSAQPENSELTIAWIELLKSVKLGEIAEQPLIQK